MTLARLSTERDLSIDDFAVMTDLENVLSIVHLASNVKQAAA